MSSHTAAATKTPAVEGRFVNRNGDDFYQIENYDQMAPFLMSIVSVGDHWMYLSSTGGLTAGRVSPEHSLFPYETADKLHDNHNHTGPVTLLRIRQPSGAQELWQPFSDRTLEVEARTPRLLKNVAGNHVIFEESHHRLGLTFRYGWQTSREFGFVRTASLENAGTADIEIEVVDGLQNLCPWGVPLSTYQQASCLADAYKHNELDPATGMGIYSLTAQISDRAEAAEILRATTVWSRGLDGGVGFLSREGLDRFRHGGTPRAEELWVGRRANYFRYRALRVAPGQSHAWHIVAEVAQSHPAVVAIRNRLVGDDSLEALLSESIADDHQDLLLNIASADGLQATQSQLAWSHHLANVLFNNMRGGVFADNYTVENRDFIKFIEDRNRETAASARSFLRGLPEQIEYAELLRDIVEQRDVNLTRLAFEYLPLTFGRRHGDPSRPWNAFEIHTTGDDGAKIYNYQGNWRDIFQNWEALCTSFPGFLASIVAKFVNASTVDGYNPYRLTRAGIDWEAPDPDDPWSNIGYWGDHQIIYLAKLLESLHDYFPGELSQLFSEQIFCYANVPYRIKPYQEIVADSSDTIQYDQFTAEQIARRVEALGADGKLVVDSQGDVYHANLVEKLLVPVLAKLSNFVPDGGIWLNTQRPEWNDANNALVGAGLSMVTVCYLRRHLDLLVELIKDLDNQRIAITVEVEQWFRGVRDVLQQHRHLLHETEIRPTDRRKVIDELGAAFSEYRLKVYDDGFSGKHTVSSSDLIEFFRLAGEFLDHAIRTNRRDDRLYHAYNLLELDEDATAARIARLYEMLEGQVAVLSSRGLDAGQAVELIDAMFASDLYREDIKSFMLYPQRQLPGFLDRNFVPVDKAQSIELLSKMLAARDRAIVVPDDAGGLHFHHEIQKLADLKKRLDWLAADERWGQLAARDRNDVLELFDNVFSHKTYTGRSGTMYGYEGLGCVYWHMVSKLLLAVQENVFAAVDRQASKAVIDSLADAYYLVRGGLSSDKTPEEYGAFPTDPYSHSPAHSGAQQPGMTGQVKEEILTRHGEFGVRVVDGRLRFQPVLLRRREFFQDDAEFSYFDLAGLPQVLTLEPGSLGFTFCQVPIIYRLGDKPLTIEVKMASGQTREFVQDALDVETSRKIFGRTGEIARIDVSMPAEDIQRA